MKHIATILALFCIFCVARPVRGEQPFPSSAPPRLIGSVALGGATEGTHIGGSDVPESFGVELKLRVQNALGPVSLNAACRHFIKDDHFWHDKSKLNLGLDVPLGADALLFADFERKYRHNENFMWAGVRLNFSAP